MRRAEEVYDAVARGQNEDGSWHKRFQVSTEAKLPDQGPYGMATEGTTLGGGNGHGGSRLEPKSTSRWGGALAR